MSHRILFVEDNDYHRLMVEDFLESRGYKIRSLPDGRELFTAIRELQPNAILLDLKLPDQDGYQLLEQIKDSQWKNIPIIIISAYAFQHEQERAFNLGACRYLTKPVRLEQIVQTIIAEIGPPQCSQNSSSG